MLRDNARRRMTFDELIDWVETALHRLDEKKVARDRRRHLYRMYEVLDSAGDEQELVRDWLALAQKIAKQLKEPLPSLDEGAAVLATRTPRERPAPKAKYPFHKKKKRRTQTPEKREIVMTPELQRAFDAVGSGKPIVFVTGGAGTGKSTFIHELAVRFPQKKMVFLAPTGVAALNAGGQTIHSFCKLPLRPVMPNDVHELDDRNVVAHLDLLVIDEVSMVRADVLDGVERFLRINRKSDAPFGGVQIVMVGDLFQLPPVVTTSDEPLLRDRYESPWFFSANCLKGLSFTPIELRVVYRQKDVNFAALLRDLRDGEEITNALSVINSECVGRKLTGGYLTLTPTRNAASGENARKLAALPGNERVYDARIEGNFGGVGDDRLPAPQSLRLKPAAQVMFVRNDAERRWVNGTIGIVESISPKSVKVRLESGELHEVEPVEWQNIRYAWDNREKRIVEEILGTFEQLPLMPAWAVTIHKAQGLTLERVVIDLGRGSFAEGQTYVALSRCQTIEGLSLARPVQARDVRTSAAARDFYAKISRRT